MTNQPYVFRQVRILFKRIVLLRFILIGAVNTAFSYGVFSMLLFSGLGVELGSLLALIAGIFFSFCTQGKIVFGSTSKAAFGRFIAAWLLIYLFNLLIIRIAMAAGASSYLAAAIATGPVVAVSYFILKRVVFRQPATLTVKEKAS